MVPLSLQQKKIIILILLFFIVLLLFFYFYLPEPKREIKIKAVLPSKNSFLVPTFSLEGVSNEETLRFEMPYDVSLDYQGNLYVTDIEGNRVFVFTREGKFSRVFGSFGLANPPEGSKASWKEGSFVNPGGVDVDVQGDIYVVDTGNKRVNVYNSKGKFLFYFPQDNLLENPTMIRVKRERVYLSDRGGIKVFDRKGKFLKVLGEGKVFNPTGIEVDREGKIYVAEPLLSRVICLSSRGDILWERGGRKSQELGIPFDLTVDNVARLLFVTDAFHHQIIVYTLEGKFLGKAGNFGKKEGEFAFPRGVCFSPHGILYVADSNNRRIQAFEVKVKALLSPEIFLKR